MACKVGCLGWYYMEVGAARRLWKDGLECLVVKGDGKREYGDVKRISWQALV